MSSPLSWVGAFLLLSAAASAGAAPRLSIAPERPSPGELFLVTVEGLLTKGSAEARFGGRSFSLWDTGARNREGLVAIDRDQKPEPADLVIVEPRPGGDAELARMTVRLGRRKYQEQRLTVPEDKVTLSATDQERAAEEAKRIGKALSTRSKGRAWEPPVLIPVEGRVSSPFGVRRIYNGKPRGYHGGIDIAAPRGTPVQVASSGRVILVGDFFYTGHTVFVDHGLGLVTAYFHMDSADVAEGQSLRGGEILGYVGSTGRSTGAHLHWSVYLAGAKADPMSWVRVAGGAGGGE